ncbi:MAG: DNA polymerase I [Planctomycetota bacterium]|jgi:DNA polymerase-1
MPKTLFLIDGHSLIYQSFYALPGLTSPGGNPTGAIFGFVKVLDKVLHQEKPDYLCVVLDAPGPTFRHDMFPQYKQNRKPMPDELREQIPVLLDLLEARGIPKLRIEGVEADDVLGTLARTGAGQGLEVRILSRDKDLKQLLADRVALVDPRNDALLDAKTFEKNTGISPAAFPDLLGLAGDTSDNIPGVPGIGEKTALTLLKEFGNLEAVLEGWEKVSGKKRKENLRDFADQARLSKALAVIKTDVPVDATLEDLVPADPEDGKVESLYTALGFTTLLKAAKEPKAKREYKTVTRRGWKGLLKRLRGAKAFAFDLETTGRDPIGAELVGLSFADRPGRALYVPVRAPKGRKLLGEAEVLDGLQPILSDPSIGKIGHNLKFDATVLLRRGVELRGIAFDTLVAAYLLNPGRRSLKLDTLAEEWLRLKTIPITDLIGEGKEQTTLDRVDLDRVSEYACEDADVALRLKEAIAPRLEEEGLTEVFERAEIPLVGILTRMECTGIRVDAGILGTLDGEVDGRLETLTKALNKVAGEGFNLNSPKQLQSILYEKMKLPSIKKTEKKTGFSTDAETLRELVHICRRDGKRGEAKFLDNLLEYRVLKKLQSTYIRALPKEIHEATDRLHASFNQAVAATGRLSSSNPNLQNIPTRTELGNRVRGAFVPSEGWCFLTADYSQIELRVMAHLSGDAELIRAFREGEDVHRAVAAEIFSVKPEKVTKEMRRSAKAVNFGILYGQTPFGLARELGIPHAEAAEYIDRYFGRYAGVKRFIDELLEKAREEGRVRTILNRLRPIPELKASNRNRRLFGERTAVNTVVQGSAADLIKLATVDVARRIRKKGWPARLLVQIHDELLFEVERGAEAEVRRGVVEAMEGAMTLSVPLRVDCTVGDNWMEL